MRKPNFLGLAGAALFFSASMSPSLIPRHWLFQGVVSGIVAAAGYGLGTFLSYLWRRLPIPEPTAVFKLWAWRVLAVVGPGSVAIMSILGLQWQRQLRRMMAMAPASAWSVVGAVLVGLTLAIGLVGVGRAIRALARRVARALSRWLPRPLASLLGGLLVGLLTIGLLDGVVVRAFFTAADDTFRLSDEAVADDTVQPTSPLRSGSLDSLADWDDLGSKGRAFVTGGPTSDELAAFSGEPSQEPIRVYAGLASADDIRSRADLVLDELVRTGAFERAVLCVITTTGTGWVDPQAADALEYIWSGNTALAALQYSYLPSWLSFMVDSARAREAGAEFFNVVYEHWAGLPVSERPLLLVFGESLGADGSEAAFSGVADLRNRTDGALWVGPPNFSELWSTFISQRAPGTPEILPVFEGGETVRFAANPEDLSRTAGWDAPRVLYLQHASDPVVWWSPRLILRQPDWMRQPPGPDVLDSVRWYPLVTFWQLSVDMANAKRVPAGHGHNYGGLFADGWAAVAAPPDWSQADTDRLHALLAAHADAALSTVLGVADNGQE